MKIDQIKTTDDTIHFRTGGEWHEITAHRPLLWRQGIVLVPVGGEANLVLQDPGDEDSAVIELADCVRSAELADYHKRWAEETLENGTHDVDFNTA